ncbi:MarR family winged helix-turn-helix transcriptional regulator [Xanthomonas maliensis]|uniref:MarR family winged helix-turn-helix transcriptional regulator n=1 Tax=Xanthomonas maliensis TaxID=1321368 RepID=UPI00039DA220|nr:MarR family winged helix-turn-helix transcriptional regulator [Xanthomonas maliensis]KAB7767053.1 MarR family transcriptional regulator [Xanthomonas maliensis]
MRDEEAEDCAEAQVAPGYLANHASRLFNRQVDALLRPKGLSLALLGPLLLLQRHGAMLQKDLVRGSPVGQPAMVALLDKLQAHAWITRTPDQHDRRAAHVRLTPRGRSMAAFGAKVLGEVNQSCLHGMSASERIQLTQLLHRLIANLEGDGLQ